MNNRVKIADVDVEVPYRSPGNVIRENWVHFEIFKDGHYIAIPQLTSAERMLANLPPELLFDYQQGKTVSLRGEKDGNFHVLEDLVQQLKNDPNFP